MKPKLYMTEMSPPSRGVMLTAEALGIDLEYVNVNFLEKEHLKPEFIKINPQHTVPTYEEGDFIICDSHAIEAYLATVHGKDEFLLPKDPKLRAIVDQRLHFDSFLFERFRQALMPLWAGSLTTIPECSKSDIRKSYAFIETFLEKNDWIAGENMTIADLSLIATISTLDEFIPVDREKFTKMADWIKRLQSLPYYENYNARGAKALGEVVRSKIKQ